MRQPVTAALLARNAGRNLAALSIPPVVALASMPLLVARLDTAHFGVLGLVWACFGLFAELGLEKGTTKYAAAAFASGQDARAIVRIGVALQLALGIVLALALALTAGPVAARLSGSAGVVTELRIVLYVIAASLPVIMVSAAYRGVLEAAHRFDLANRVRLLVGVATYLLPAALVVAGGGVVLIAAALAVVRVCATLIYMGMSARLLHAHDAAETERAASEPRSGTEAPARLAGARTPGWAASGRLHSDAEAQPRRAGLSTAPPITKLMLSFGAWQTASALFAPLLLYLDRFVLGAIAGVAAVALYTPAFEVATRLLLLPASVVMALFPAFSAWTGGAEQERSARTAARAVLYITAALVPLVVLVLGLGRDALTLWLNAEFARQTAVALSILCCGALLNAAAYVPATLLQGVGRPDIPAKLYLIELPIYVALLAWFVSSWGVAGAAAAWAVRVALDAALLFSATHRLGVLPASELTRARVPQSLVGAIVLSLAPATLAGSIADPWLRAGATSVALGAGVIFLWSYALRANGRARIAQALGLASS